ncbi:MAG: aspartyl/glutamyl-tRNA amidotransferase subunit C [Firmicutes bacterium]|nr:aspartyl/glutamyl-tRNA amidotransferase subunit C [Bacillota bacterium]
MDTEKFDVYCRFNKFVLEGEEKEELRDLIRWQLSQLAPLAELDCGDTPPMIYLTSLRQVLREDVAEQTVSREEILACAPEEMDGAYVTPRVAD